MLRGVAGVGVVVALCAVYWLSPWSPEAIDRPALLLGWGFPHLALQAWENMGDGPGPEGVQAEALWRASLVATAELDDNQRAIELLRQLVADHPTHPRAPQAYARLASLYERAQGDDLRAAEAWQQAADAAPSLPESGRRYMLAGRAWQRGGQRERAQAAFQAATQRPDVAVVAWLALGTLQLQGDPRAAYAACQSAIKAGAADADLSSAWLCSASALEREGRLDDALDLLLQVEQDGKADDAISQRIHLLEQRTSL